MKYSVKAAVISIVFFSISAHAGDDLEFVKKIHSKVPDITPFEKHCLYSVKSGRDIEKCLDSQPKTELYKYEQARRNKYLDTFKELAAEIEYSEDSDPWFTYCLHNESVFCLEACVNGWICSDW